MNNKIIRILILIFMVFFVGGSSYWFCGLLPSLELKILWSIICAAPYGYYTGKLTMEWLDENYPLDEY